MYINELSKNKNEKELKTLNLPNNTSEYGKNLQVDKCALRPHKHKISKKTETNWKRYYSKSKIWEAILHTLITMIKQKMNILTKINVIKSSRKITNHSYKQKRKYNEKVTDSQIEKENQLKQNTITKSSEKNKKLHNNKEHKSLLRGNETDSMGKIPDYARPQIKHKKHKWKGTLKSINNLTKQTKIKTLINYAKLQDKTKTTATPTTSIHTLNIAQSTIINKQNNTQQEINRDNRDNER